MRAGEARRRRCRRASPPPMPRRACSQSGADALVALRPQSFDRACGALRALAVARRKDIALIRGAPAEVATAEAVLIQRSEVRDEKATAGRDAAERRDRRRRGSRRRRRRRSSRAGSAISRACGNLAVSPTTASRASRLWPNGWFARRRQSGAAAPCRRRSRSQLAAPLSAAWHSTAAAGRWKANAQRSKTNASAWTAGDDAGAARAAYPRIRRHARRARVRRSGNWSIFTTVGRRSERAGLEAALEASGLLDAWITPDGRLQTGAGRQRPRQPGAGAAASRASLGGWLRGRRARGMRRAGRLSSTPCSPGSPAVPTIRRRRSVGRARRPLPPRRAGRRLGQAGGGLHRPCRPRRGAHAPPGRDRRAAGAARRRAGDVATRPEQLDADRARRPPRNGALAPSDEALRQAHIVAVGACARERQAARERLARGRYRVPRSRARPASGARSSSRRDAADLRLPPIADALAAVEDGAGRLQRRAVPPRQAAHELRLALPELRRQRERESEARDDLSAARSSCRDAASKRRRRTHASRCCARRSAPRSTSCSASWPRPAGASRRAKRTAQGARTSELRERGEARAVASAEGRRGERASSSSAARRAPTPSTKLQQFAATGLLSGAPARARAAGPGRQPGPSTPRSRWRAVPSRLSPTSRTTTRPGRGCRRQIAEDLTELQRALSALGHQAQAETSDWGLVVHIVYQNRPERPDRLAARLARGDRPTQRAADGASERAVLENHLQAEIAAEVQRLLQAAESAARRDQQASCTTARPPPACATACCGSRSARRKARRSASKPRASACSTPAPTCGRPKTGASSAPCCSSASPPSASAPMPAPASDGGGSLIDQLARALDYRRWHRFRVERWQDGHWRKLSGPASSGERALGLTVPLFAAVASFYSQGSYALAPRLMLLDEAFAGIDDAARAHCMGLIREFDLDFVITSEREWACYAELPGVAICQLQRAKASTRCSSRAGPGTAGPRRREDDPDRRFAPA